MEYALSAVPSQLGELKGRLPAGFGRLYLGDEFCQRRLPGLGDLRAAKKRFSAELTLATPPLTTAYVERTFRLVRDAAAEGLISEAVVNDLGLLSRLAGPGGPEKLRLSAGRVLAGVLDCSLFSGRVAALFGGRLRSFEADREETLLQARDGRRRRAHFHAPLAYAGAGRFCPFAGGLNGRCGHGCGDALLPLACAEPGMRMTAPLYARANAYFTDNSAVFRAAGGLAGLLARYPMVRRLVISAEALRGGGLAFLRAPAPGRAE